MQFDEADDPHGDLLNHLTYSIKARLRVNRLTEAERAALPLAGSVVGVAEWKPADIADEAATAA